jgi:anti-anti-sigma factor
MTRSPTTTSGLYFDLRIDYSTRQIAVHGEFDAATAPCLATALTGLQRASGGQIGIGLDAVTFMDPVGLGALVGARSAQKDRGDDLVVTGASDRVRRLILRSGLADLLEADATHPTK